MDKELNYRLIASLQIVTAVGLILYWLAFFTVSLAPLNPPDCYFAYEHAFPLPDGLLSALLLIAGIIMMKNNPTALKLSLVAAGGLMFLGLLDFSFNIQNGSLYGINCGPGLECVDKSMVLRIWTGDGDYDNEEKRCVSTF